MSRDIYELDVTRHGAPHVDRYSPNGKLIGRYRLDGSPIEHKGVLPPPIPVSDKQRFDAEIARAQK
jgi:hypothetical protein